ncbi:MAG TPA: Maf family protein [Rectinemataceae bacterium]|nr:Maf family protein [Rectinemataceae bacterium]
MEPLLLASSSPRRSHILRSLGIPFVLADPDVDESLRDHLPPPMRVVALAEDKARAAASRTARDTPNLVIAADTLVCLRLPGGKSGIGSPGDQGLEEIVLGKPCDRADARRMISLLAGRVHTVHTGLVVLDRRSDRIFPIRSDSFVTFSAIDESEIEAYLESGEWEGVAGAYRIQGWTALYITKIEGSWSGIMGLPIHELYAILNEAGYRLRPQKAAI